MAQHTKGPWRVCEHSWSDTSVLADGFDHAICCLDINHATEESQDADSAIMEANARLIAAAPDLLEALKSLVDRDFTFFSGAMLGSTRKITRDEVLAARAAIAKATGHL